jgi:hypothetical protein
MSKPPLIMDRYKGRPKELARVKACAEAWERLRAAGGPWTPYKPPANLPLGPHCPPCCCADGGVWQDGRCTRCWGWPRPSEGG